MQILTSYNLSGGTTFSSEVLNPFYVRLQYEVEGATDIQQVITLEWLINDGSGYVPMLNDKGVPVQLMVAGNKKGSLNIATINSSGMKIKVTVPDGSDGTINLFTCERDSLGELVNSSPFVPPDDLDISGSGYTSSQIDAYLIYHAENMDTLNPDKNTMDIRGNENPTSASLSARKTLSDNYIPVIYNIGYDPN